MAYVWAAGSTLAGLALFPHSPIGPTMSELQLLTTDEVARLLRVSTETVRQLAASGELPGRKIGRAWRFPHAAIVNYATRGITACPAGTGVANSVG
jgi:excisionase family DNA binding protein